MNMNLLNYEDRDRSSVPFVPGNPLPKNILNKFMDKESADVIFEVNNGRDEAGTPNSKSAKTTTAFRAHYLVLKDGAPTLAEFSRPSGEVASIRHLFLM